MIQWRRAVRAPLARMLPLRARFVRILPLRARRRLLFDLNHGYRLPETPQTFSEKVQWRILHDRRPEIALTGDKLRMKAYAASRSARVQIPETLWSGEDLSAVADVDWGGPWVLKPIAGSGRVAFGAGSLRASGVDPERLRSWRVNHQLDMGEWAYSQGRRGYLIERRIELPDGGIPSDLKFFVFDGRARLVYAATPRSDGERHRFYSPGWVPLDFRREDVAVAEVTDAPQHLEDAVGIAEELGRGYDFIRVDLYDTPDGVHFGELTPYPAGGLRRFSPPEVDREIGAWWRLPDQSMSIDR